ncbi:Uncharacterized protein FWK35_00025026 [Aphis craccivora]|uniref:Uncharacterized protein n=1 Tax=Aphis craccivora TaxID=307492 RepID=A0A6G0Y6M1_APHCR|nr:Uncharacterized protein FWK35_00025026 [Aphis craccivora]
MWTVVHFTNENVVEAVPSHWVKKDKHIHHRSIINKFDFDYFPSRTLKKGIVIAEQDTATTNVARSLVKLELLMRKFKQQNNKSMK